MIRGVVNTDKEALEALSDRLMLAINNSTLIVHASTYGEPIKHISQDKYALILRKEPKFMGIVNQTLTKDEKKQIENLTEDWFKE